MEMSQPRRAIPPVIGAQGTTAVASGLASVEVASGSEMKGSGNRGKSDACSVRD